MRTTREHELKLAASDGFRLSDLEGVELPSRDFVSTYFDTPDLTLARNGLTLRHRAEEGSRLWQLKIPSGAARLEIEAPGSPAQPPAELLALLLVHLRGVKPARVARLRTRRKTLRTAGAEIVEDSVSVMEGQRVKERFRELEVELVGEGDERTLRRLEKQLLAAGAEPAGFRPKLFRALELSPGVETAPLSPHATPQEVLSAALAGAARRSWWRTTRARVSAATRRISTRCGSPRAGREHFCGPRGHSWIRSGATSCAPSSVGSARPSAPLVISTCSSSTCERRSRSWATREPRCVGSSTASSGGDERRARLPSPRCRRIAISAWSIASKTSQPPPAASGASPTLAELWWAEFVRTRRRFERLDRKSSDDELHAARIRVKRTRYAAELAASELGVAGERFVEAAKLLQDVLGAHQDAFVAEQHIRAWSEGKTEAADVVRTLLKRERARRKSARAEWPQAWRLLERRARKARP